MSVLVNWEKVNELCNEVGQEDFDEVVELFLEEVEETLGHVGQEGRCLEHDLHFLKGSALNLGFVQFSDLCKVGEAAAANGDGAQVDVAKIQLSYQESRTLFLGERASQLQAS